MDAGSVELIAYRVCKQIPTRKSEHLALSPKGVDV